MFSYLMTDAYPEQLLAVAQERSRAMALERELEGRRAARRRARIMARRRRLHALLHVR